MKAIDYNLIYEDIQFLGGASLTLKQAKKLRVERFKARSRDSELKAKQSLAKLIKRVRRPLGKLVLVFVLFIMMLTYIVLNIILTIETYLKEIYQVLKPPSRKKQPQKKNNYRQQKKGLK